MIAILMVAAAAAAALMTQQGAATNEIDPLVGTPLVTSPDPAALHAKVRSEARDDAWAPRMEAAIRSRLLQIPLIGKDGNVLRVTCATDICEMAGTIIWPAPLPKDYDPKLPQNRAESDLQGKSLTDDFAELGLKHEMGLFTGGKGKPDRAVFLIYYSRAKS